jgi:hypothetical protein
MYRESMHPSTTLRMTQTIVYQPLLTKVSQSPLRSSFARHAKRGEMEDGRAAPGEVKPSVKLHNQAGAEEATCRVVRIADSSAPLHQKWKSNRRKHSHAFYFSL